MTYSRPQPRQTARANRPVQPNRVGVRNQTQQQSAGTSRLIDLSDPGQAGKNASQGYDEIKNFLTQIAEPLTEYLKQEDIANANRQVGELIQATPNLGQLYAEAPDEARAKMRSLSPRAKDLAMQRVTETAVYRYGEAYQKEALASPILSDPAREAEWEAEKRRIITEQRDKSGLSNLPPGYVASQSAAMAQVEGQAAGALDTARSKVVSQRYDAGAQDAYGKQWSKFSGWFEQVDSTAFESPEQKLEYTAKGISNLNQWIQGEITKAGDAADGTPETVLSNLVKGWTQEYTNLLLLGETDQAQALLNALTTASKGQITVGEKTNLWDLPVELSNGRSVSIQQFLLTADNQLDAVKNKGFKEAAEESLKDLLPLIVNGSPEQQAEALAQVPARIALLPPGAYLDAIRLAGGTETFAQRETLEQKQNLADLVYSDRFKQLSPEAKKQELDALAAQNLVNPGAALNYLNRVQGTGEQVADGLAQQARLKSTPNADKGIVGNPEDEATLQRLAGISEEYGKLAPNSSTVEADTAQAVVRAEAATSKEIQKRQAAGESITNEQASEIYSTKLKEYVAQFEEERREGITQIKAGKTDITIKEQVNSFIAARAAGKKRLDAIPESLKEEYSRLYPGEKLTADGLIAFLAGKMSLVKNKDGAFTYGKDRAATRKWLGTQLDKALKGAEAPSQSPRPYSGSLMDRLFGVPTGGGDGKEQSNSGSESDRASSVGGPSLSDIAMAGLSTVANVLTPPAQAGTLTANQEQLTTMMRMWERREPPALSTPGLPQVVATARVESVPVAINTPKHPFFVAIGIAEGTRTPNGAYTQAYYGHNDPGDGNRNMGTVSGGRNGEASPQQVDRNWMSILTRAQMKYAPILRRFGITNGTQGYNRMMFNLLDLRVQSPAAVPDLIKKLPEMIRSGLSVEAIAKARSDSFFTPSGRLDAPGFNNSYQRLYQDQRSRAGVWDYRRRM